MQSAPRLSPAESQAFAAPADDTPAARTAATVLRVLDGVAEFHLHCQPIVDLRRGVVAGYEALARFPDGARPDECLEMAGRLGRGIELENLLVRDALRLRSSLPTNTFLSVNFSPDFMLSPQWDALMRDFGDLSRLVFEITEQAPITDYAAMRRRIAAIHKAGGGFAVDDTGAGYSSLKHILELRPDFIKLDRLFVHRCHVESPKRAFIELLGETADRLDAWIVAEGVEEQPELEELMRLEVPLGQGWLMGKPAAGMRDLEPSLGDWMRRRAVEGDRHRSVLPHTELCPTLPTEVAAHALLMERPSLLAVAVVDAWNRPLEIVERHPLLGIRAVPNLMRVQAASDPEQVLARAVNRAAARVFDAAAVIDEQGAFVGVLRMDVLVRALMAGLAPEADSSATQISAEKLQRLRTLTSTIA